MDHYGEAYEAEGRKHSKGLSALFRRGRGGRVNGKRAGLPRGGAPSPRPPSTLRFCPAAGRSSGRSRACLKRRPTSRGTARGAARWRRGRARAATPRPSGAYCRGGAAGPRVSAGGAGRRPPHELSSTLRGAQPAASSGNGEAEPRRRAAAAAATLQATGRAWRSCSGTPSFSARSACAWARSCRRRSTGSRCGGPRLPPRAAGPAAACEAGEGSLVHARRARLFATLGPGRLRGAAHCWWSCCGSAGRAHRAQPWQGLPVPSQRQPPNKRAAKIQC